VSGVVVGIDGSPGGRLALRFALEEARLRGLPLRVVCAWQTPLSQYESLTLSPDLDLRLNAEPGVPVEAAAVEGHPALVLAEYAKDADLLVVGSRGRGGFKALVLGSVSTAVVHHAPCPVVIVPTRPGE
jgi:nucleotide-binding universal stress UspA family protein